MTGKNNMHQQSYIVGILAAATIGIFPISAQAQSFQNGGGNSAVSQQISQTTSVVGNSNQINKYITNINIDRSGRGGRGQRRFGNRAVVQNQNQGVDIRGDRNSVRQNGRQFNSDRGNTNYIDRSI